MEWFRKALKRREEKNRIVQLRYQLDDNSTRFLRDTKGLRPTSEDFQEKYVGYMNERDLLLAEIRQIQSKQMFEKAIAWGIPLPKYPKSPDLDDDNWEWNSVHGRHYLTTAAMASIRRQAFQEMDMLMKPWLSWAAIAISVISLIVAVFKP